MIRAKGFACAENRLWRKIAVGSSLLFALLGLCTALAQTPTLTTTTTATETATLTPSPTETATVTPTATPAATLTQTPNASASPTVTKTRTITRTPTRTRTRTQTPEAGLTATVTPVPGNEVLVGYIPVVGSLPGNFGSFFKTSVQLLNPGASASSGRLVFHPAGVSGQPTDPSLDWTLAPGQIASYADIVTDFGESGLGSVDVFVDEGNAVPILTARIFDDAGDNGTSGFTEPFVLASDVPDQGSGFLVGPSDVSNFRFNVGLRTLDNPVSVMATVRDSGGHVLHSVTRHYDANVFVQTSSTDFLGFSLGPDQSIELAFTGGGLIAYGATVDNVTNDPSAQFLSYVTAAPLVAQRAGTSRGGGSSASVKLALVLAMLGAGAGIVIARR
jgi:hypothetical protein